MSLLLFTDTETTSFIKPGVEIVQIAAILQDSEDKQIYAEVNLIVNANWPIPPETTAIHGITDKISATMGIPMPLADELFATLATKADTIVCHNVVFDTGIINTAWPGSALAIKNKPTYCTMLEGAKINIPKRHAGKSKWPKLSDAYFYFFGENFENAHDAMADVRACRDVYFKLVEGTKQYDLQPE